jgi:hypothetical protein
VQNVVRTQARTRVHTHTRTHAPHTAMFLPWITDQGFAWCAVCRLSRATVRLHEPFYDDKSLTLLAACNVEGFVMPACYVAEETIDSEAFVAWVRHYLCPCLGNYAMAEPNSVLVLDNVNQHWSPVAMALIRARGTEIIFLPPYSLPPYSPEVGPLSRMSAVVCN